jgi:aldose sugar dehydrogenase
MRKRVTIGTTVFCFATSAAYGQTISEPGLELTPYLTGFAAPIAVRFIGADRAFVIQKEDGRVIYVDHGVRTTVLDLNVQHESERGLLGIALDPGFAINGFVYLYHSVTTANADSVTSAEWVANRVSRYTWNGSALVSPVVLGDFGTNDPSQPNGPNHNGGVIAFGPDGRLYGTTGDLNRQGFEQNAQGAPSAGVGGIFRIASNGSVPADNPFGTTGAFSRWYAYGVRNSFGISFDPVTGALWDTENGPADNDEINLVPRGFNSGWNKIQGPDSRDPQNAPADLAVLPGSVYSDPEFTFVNTIGITSIQFLAASSLGEKYLDTALTGNSNTGELYRFRLNTARNGFVLSGALADLVADTVAERAPLVFGQGFGVVSDMTGGPDGAIYVTSLDAGTIYRIARRPSNDLLVDFGPQYGLWLRRNDSVWEAVHAVAPQQMAAGDLDNNGRSDVLVDFGSPYGIWAWRNGTNWTQVHGTSSTQIVATDLDNNGISDFVINFGPQYGLWVRRNDASWSLLHGVSPRQVVSANLDSDPRRDLIVDFGPQYGIWLYMNDSNWVALHGTSAKDIVVGDLDGNGLDDIIIDFGPQYGLWIRMNQTSWVPLHGVSSQHMVVGNIDADPRKDVVVDFGSQYGIWVWKNNSSWQLVRGAAAEALAMADLDRNGTDDLIVDFGPASGLWAWRNGTTWTSLHGTSPRKFIGVDVDGQ